MSDEPPSPHPQRWMTLFLGALLAFLAATSVVTLCIRTAGYSANDLTPLGPAAIEGLALAAIATALTAGAAASLLYPFRRTGAAAVFRRVAAATLVQAVAAVCHTAAYDRLYPDDRRLPGLLVAGAGFANAALALAYARRLAPYDEVPP